MDVRKSVPATQVSMELQGVQAGPLLRDVLEKDIIEGVIAAKIGLDMSGDVCLSIDNLIDIHAPGIRRRPRPARQAAVALERVNARKAHMRPR